MIRFSRFLWVILLSVGIVGLDSCQKAKPEPELTSATIQGNWKIAGLSVDPAFQGVTDLAAALKFLGETCLADIVVSFKTDGTISYDRPASCASAPISQQVLQLLFAGAKYTETGTTVTLTDATNTQTVATKTTLGGSMQLRAQRDINPGGAPEKTTYIITLTRQ
ncbi:hypothetical protein F5984_22555 [Rudanella paleaurantiibacter]|uniref:Lipocalin-like domain-containing protein n=1 Tax=Rudanella paleaurantiibacter TaxID=2614655 RepID=A0A7J5TT83_9BACT|nr:hypothetical protein [Rudanella paleaurantiibacter]KAB7727023.1 hypothetical protein F5984_22555 [Rudanella paleaurantiibacter]